MERIATGFSLAEAPTIAPDGTLLVSDVIAGGVRRFRPDGTEIAPLLDRRRGIGGMGILPNGRVVVTGRDLSTVDDAGVLEPIADLPERGTGFNDIGITPDGTIVAGVLTSNPLAGGPLQRAIVTVMTPNGSRADVDIDFGWPNGIGFSADGDLIWISDFDTGVVYSGPWEPGSTTLDLEPWAGSPSGDADGLSVTKEGVWVAGGAGRCLFRYDAAGALVDKVEVPDDFVSSCREWPDSGSLVITTGTSVFVHDLG